MVVGGAGEAVPCRPAMHHPSGSNRQEPATPHRRCLVSGYSTWSPRHPGYGVSLDRRFRGGKLRRPTHRDSRLGDGVLLRRPSLGGTFHATEDLEEKKTFY